jgi:hypothetical protein
MLQRLVKSTFWTALALSAVGCVQGSTTAGPALVHPKFPYAVTYDDEKSRSVLGDDWRLENYRHLEQSQDIERKEGYELAYELDFNDDDKPDVTRRLPFPDLLFVHKRTNARLEVSTIVLGERRAHKELRVLLQDVVDGRSGTKSLFVGLGELAVGVEKRFATRLVDVAEASLGEQKGVAATLERADLDQLQANPQTPWQRSRVFMMHAPFQYVAEEDALSSSADPSAARKFHPYRVLFLVEYTNTMEDFDSQYPEFVRLLEKTHVLTDAMLLEYLAKPLARCKGQGSQGKVKVAISATGDASVAFATGVEPTCATGVIGPYNFAGTGEARSVEWEYDFNRVTAPAWLSPIPYRETRQVSSAAPAPSAPEAPKDGAPPSSENGEPAPAEIPAPAPAPAPAPEAPAPEAQPR